MIAVRAGFRDYRYHAAGHFSVLRVVVVRFDAVFLNGIRIGKDVARVPQPGHIDSAVQVVAHRSCTAVHAAINKGSLLRVPQGDDRIRLAWIKAAVLNARCELQQLIRVAIHQRQVNDFLIFYGAPDFRAGGVHKRHTLRDCDRLVYVPQLEHRIHTRRNIYFQHDATKNNFLESRLGDLHPVVADRKEKEFDTVLASAARLRRSREVCVRVRYRHLSAGDRATVRIGHSAIDGGRGELRPQNIGKQHGHQAENHPHCEFSTHRLLLSVRRAPLRMFITGILGM